MTATDRPGVLTEADAELLADVATQLGRTTGWSRDTALSVVTALGELVALAEDGPAALAGEPAPALVCTQDHAHDLSDQTQCFAEPAARQPAPVVSAEQVRHAAEVMGEARWPEGVWTGGTSEPPEADDETVLRAALATLGIEVQDRG